MPDFLTKGERSIRMSRIPGSNTGPEREAFRRLRKAGVYFAKHVPDLPGRPDIVFRKARLAVFVDGDFWHGRNFARWRLGLNEYWREKIARTIARDRTAVRRLRAAGWRVIRLWAKDLQRHPDSALQAVLDARRQRLGIGGFPARRSK